ncbi:hypothetical protein ACM6L3_14100 [Paenibacillus larvae]
MEPSFLHNYTDSTHSSGSLSQSNKIDNHYHYYTLSLQIFNNL